jgi:hypothetical protein
MQKSMTALAAAGIVLVGASSVAAATDNQYGAGSQVLRLVTRTDQFTLVDNDKDGPGLGDSLIISDRVFQGGKQVGTDGITCTFVTATAHSLTNHCVMTLSLRNGQITMQGLSVGPAGPPREPFVFEMAITGGTGAYRSARGATKVVDLPDETERLTVHLLR